jgi:hypothetical protein
VLHRLDEADQFPLVGDELGVVMRDGMVVEGEQPLPLMQNTPKPKPDVSQSTTNSFEKSGNYRTRAEASVLFRASNSTAAAAD